MSIEVISSTGTLLTPHVMLWTRVSFVAESVCECFNLCSCWIFAIALFSTPLPITMVVARLRFFSGIKDLAPF